MIESNRSEYQHIYQEIDAGFDEIAATLDSLSSLATGDEPFPTQDLITQLASIRGAFEILECYGIAFLIDELIALLEYSLSGNHHRSDSIWPTIASVLFQLKIDISHIKEIHMDCAMRFVPICNNLRVLRAAPLIITQALFIPDMHVLDSLSSPVATHEVMHKIVKNERVQYQKGLAGLLRREDIVSTCLALKKALSALMLCSQGMAYEYLWKSAYALVELIEADESQLDHTIINLFVQLDRVIKQAVSNGMPSTLAQSEQTLIKNCLYYIMCTTLETDTITALKAQFALDEVGYIIAAGESSLDDVEKHNQHIINVRVNAIAEELRSCRNLCMHMQSASYPALVQILQSVIDGASLLNLSVIARHMRRILVPLHKAEDDESAWQKHVDVIMQAMDRLAYALTILKEKGLAGATSAQFVYRPYQFASIVQEQTPDQMIGSPDSLQIQEAMQEDNSSDEMTSIFLEEVLEEMASLLSNLSILQSAPDDEEALTEMHRSFHTLKGSARLVSANDIANLSAAVENLLNALSDNKIGLPPEVLQIINRACDIFPDLTESFSRAQAPETNVDIFVEKVNALRDKICREASEVLGTVDQPPAQSASAHPEEIDEELFSIFLEEAEEILARSNLSLEKWGENINDTQEVIELHRELHTLKGGARMAELSAIADLSHEIEFIYSALLDKAILPTEEIFTLSQKAHDYLAQMVESSKQGEDYQPADEIISQCKRLYQSADGEQSRAIDDMPVVDMPIVDTIKQDVIQPSVQDSSQPANVDQALQDTEQPERVTEQVSPVSKQEPRRLQQEMVRVHPDILENMLNTVGESRMLGSRLDREANESQHVVEDLDVTVEKMREQVRRLELESEASILFRQEGSEMKDYGHFDPLEMDRYSALQEIASTMGETLSDLISIKDNLLKRARQSSLLIGEQNQTQSDLQESLLGTRMLPLGNMVPRLRRIVRQVSNELNKKIILDFSGVDVEMDRTIESRIGSPLDHMIRNAIDHGIESPEERHRLGKPETGHIRIDVKRDGSDILIYFSDDGHGVDVNKVRARALATGMIAPDTEISERRILQFIFMPGFSTSSDVTQISGRGVGMDVVASEVKSLGGSVAIESEPGKGTRFIIRLPYSLSLSQVVMIQCQSGLYAIALANVRGIVRMSPKQLRHNYLQDKRQFQYAKKQYQLIHLDELLGFMNKPSIPEAGRLLPVILLKHGDVSTAIQVDEIIGSREIVVKTLGPPLQTTDGVTGATIVADGGIALILDARTLIQKAENEGRFCGVSRAQFAGEGDRTRIIMVVDDSITVRKVTSRFLQRHGYDVVTAKDGLDAQHLLCEVTPDLMLLDLEMPRMDGFELATYMRNNPDFSHIPVIIITSRTGKKHREHAQGIGVDHYLGKPYQETELLQIIVGLLAAQSKELSE